MYPGGFLGFVAVAMYRRGFNSAIDRMITTINVRDVLIEVSFKWSAFVKNLTLLGAGKEIAWPCPTPILALLCS